MKKALLFLLLAFALVACGEKKSEGGDEPTLVTENYTGTYEEGSLSQDVTLTRNKAENNRIEKIVIKMQMPAEEGPAQNAEYTMVVEYSGTEATKIAVTLIVDGTPVQEKLDLDTPTSIKKTFDEANGKKFIDTIFG